MTVNVSGPSVCDGQVTILIKHPYPELLCFINLIIHFWTILLLVIRHPYLRKYEDDKSNFNNSAQFHEFLCWGVKKIGIRQCVFIKECDTLEKKIGHQC